jgi:hypothetical protein
VSLERCIDELIPLVAPREKLLQWTKEDISSRGPYFEETASDPDRTLYLIIIITSRKTGKFDRDMRKAFELMPAKEQARLLRIQLDQLETATLEVLKLLD